jgi:FkbM family methyltransferase
MDYMRLPNGLKVAHVNPGETALLYRRIFTEECYLHHGIEVKPGDTVIDVGANIGMASLYFGHRGDVTVYAFEPAPATYEALAENLRMHGVPGGSRRLALSDEPGTRTFTYYPHATVMSGLYADADEDSALTREFLRQSGFGAEDVDDIIAERYEQVPFLAEITTLAREIDALGIESIDLLKLDVEKSELRVLHGMRDEDWPKVKQIVAEVHDFDGRLEEFSSLLRGRGFSVAAEQEDQLVGTEVYSVFAVRA